MELSAVAKLYVFDHVSCEMDEDRRASAIDEAGCRSFYF